MLKTLDILIGVATVMLLFSMVVTVITQFVISALQSRGRNLKNGLAGLLKQFDPTIGKQLADEISTALLKHPLTVGRLGALGTVIHREEFTTLLMEMASGQSVNQLNNNAKVALNRLLKNNGVPDPASTLKNVRDFALQLESSNPELANDVRHSMAVLQEAKSEFVGKVHGWFDQTIDRVSQRFTLSAHAITFIVAIIVAFAVQLDTLFLINRLSADDGLREAMVKVAPDLLHNATNPEKTQNNSNPQSEGNVSKQNPAGGTQAQKLSPPGHTVSTATTSSGQADKGKPAAKAGSKQNKKTSNASAGQTSTTTASNSGGGSTPSTSQGSGIKQSDQQKEAQQEIYDTLSKNGLITEPQQFKWPFAITSLRTTDATGKKTWHWPITWGGPTGRQLLGILISALLLSLGAPFWYSALQNLLRLRSALAQKDDQQRQTRQTTQEDGATTKDGKGTSTAPPNILQGEKGNLQAVG